MSVRTSATTRAGLAYDFFRFVSGSLFCLAQVTTQRGHAFTKNKYKQHLCDLLNKSQAFSSESKTPEQNVACYCLLVPARQAARRAAKRIDDLRSNQRIGKSDSELDHCASRPLAVRSAAVKKEITNRIEYGMAVNQFVIQNVVWSRPDDNASAGIDPLGRFFPAKRPASLSVPMAKDDTKLTGARRLTDLFLEQA
jgi:hypothetical protein